MASKTYTQILQELAPQSTGNHPLNFSIPVLFYHFGQYHVASLVTGGQSDSDFSHKNRDAGKLLGLAIYHPESKTGEYLSPARAREKYGLDVCRYINANSAKINPDEVDHSITLPARFRPNIARRFMTRRASMEDYNAQIMLAATKDPANARRLLSFCLNPDFHPRHPRPMRFKMFRHYVLIIGLALCFMIVSAAATNYHQKYVELDTTNQKLTTEMGKLKIENATQSANVGLLSGTYAPDHIISANDRNGQIADHVRGNRDAKVVVIEYADYQCPACASANPIVGQLVQKYSDQIAFVFRNRPLESIHDNAIIAARYAEAAGQQGHFWEMHDALFANQDLWANSSGPERRRVFLRIANQASSDFHLTSLPNDAESDAVYAKLGFDIAIATTIHQVNATPSFVVDGKLVNFDGASDLQTPLEAAIKEALGQ